MMTMPPEDGADDLVARAQRAAQMTQRAALVKRLTEGGIVATALGTMCHAEGTDTKLAAMITDWGCVMLQAAKALKDDA